MYICFFTQKLPEMMMKLYAIVALIFCIPAIKGGNDIGYFLILHSFFRDFNPVEYSRETEGVLH